MDLSVLRRTAAEIVAAAVYELYPGIDLLGGGETSVGFAYEFEFPYPIHVHLYEEKMRAIIRQRRPIRTLEMVAFSARELLKSKELFKRAEILTGEGLVQLIQIGDFIDLSPGPHLKNSFELAAFRLQAKRVEGKKMRIEGWCHRSKDELKKFLKVLASYEPASLIGEKMGFWKGDIWFEKGLLFRQKLLRFLKSQWFQKAFEIATPLDCDRELLHRSMGRDKIAEIWTKTPHETHFQISFFNKSKGDLISFLQTIRKTLTMLDFDHLSATEGPATVFFVVDAIGRNRELVRLKKVMKKGDPTVDFYVLAEVEKIVSQMVENNLMMVEFENQ